MRTYLHVTSLGYDSTFKSPSVVTRFRFNEHCKTEYNAIFLEILGKFKEQKVMAV